MRRLPTFTIILGAWLALHGCSRADTSKTKTQPVVEATPPEPPATAPTAGRPEISVTEDGFEPDKLQVKKGDPVKLAFTRKTDKTCAKEVVIQLGDGQKLQRPLPLNETVEVEVTFAKAGEFRYACAMDMITGVITVE